MAPFFVCVLIVMAGPIFFGILVLLEMKSQKQKSTSAKTYQDQCKEMADACWKPSFQPFQEYKAKRGEI